MGRAEPILKEYCVVMQRPKFGLSAGAILRWAELIEMRTNLVPVPRTELPQLRDPNDAIFLAAAVASSADFLITGDKDLLELKAAVTTQIVTVADFAKLIGIS